MTFLRARGEGEGRRARAVGTGGRFGGVAFGEPRRDGAPRGGREGTQAFLAALAADEDHLWIAAKRRDGEGHEFRHAHAGA